METNLHYHGMSVTPIVPGDDVFLHVGSGADYLYEWDVRQIMLRARTGTTSMPTASSRPRF